MGFPDVVTTPDRPTLRTVKSPVRPCSGLVLSGSLPDLTDPRLRTIVFHVPRLKEVPIDFSFSLFSGLLLPFPQPLLLLVLRRSVIHTPLASLSSPSTSSVQFSPISGDRPPTLQRR